MAYEPKTWQCGEVVTANDLNRIEQGIADANTLVIRRDHVEGDFPNINAIYDKTWREVRNAIISGKFIAVMLADDESYALQGYVFKAATEPYVVEYIDLTVLNTKRLYACSEDGYLQDAECGSSGGGGSESAG